MGCSISIPISAVSGGLLDRKKKPGSLRKSESLGVSKFERQQFSAKVVSAANKENLTRPQEVA